MFWETDLLLRGNVHFLRGVESQVNVDDDHYL